MPGPPVILTTTISVRMNAARMTMVHVAHFMRGEHGEHMFGPPREEGVFAA